MRTKQVSTRKQDMQVAALSAALAALVSTVHPAAVAQTPPQTFGIGDFVWEDENRNGIQEVGESGVNGVAVQLYTASNTLVATTTTGNGPFGTAGFYTFAGVSVGEYYLRVVSPSGALFSPQGQGSNPAVDSNADASGKVNVPNLIGNAVDYTLDAGIYFATGTIGDLVWSDLDSDGLQDNGEPGVNGVRVNLFTGDGTLIATTTTGNGPSGDAGYYSFSGLVFGDYQVGFVPLAGYQFTTINVGANDALDSDASPTTGRTSTIALGYEQANKTIDAGLRTIPEPGTLTLLGFSLAGLGFSRRKQ